MPILGMGHLNDWRDRVCGSNDYDCIRLSRFHCVDRRVGLGSLARVGTNGHRLRTVFLQRILNAVENGSTKRIIWMDDADFLEAEHLPKPVNLLFCFVSVASTDVYDPMMKRRVQSLRTGKETDERNFVRLRKRNVFHASRSSNEKAHREDALLLQMVEAGFGFCRVVTVIGRKEPELSAVDTTFRVYRLKVRFCSGDGLRAQELRWSFQRGTRADGDFLIRNSGRGLR